MNYQFLYEWKDFLFQNLDIFLIVVVLVLGVVYGKCYFRGAVLRAVMYADAYQESSTGQEKLSLARKTFLLTISKRFKFLSVILDIMIPETLFNNAVDSALDYIKDILDKNKENQVAKVDVLSKGIAEVLKSKHVKGNYDVTSNEQIDKGIQEVKEIVDDKQGYARLYARYNEREKTSVGAEVGIKF